MSGQTLDLYYIIPKPYTKFQVNISFSKDDREKVLVTQFRLKGNNSYRGMWNVTKVEFDAYYMYLVIVLFQISIQDLKGRRRNVQKRNW